jgi:hypothetical protein
MRLLLAAALMLAVQAQSAPQGTASLQGTVVSVVGNAPVANASVVIARVGGALTDYRAVETDSGGKFVVRDLAAGSYRVYAEREGFLRGEHGSRFSGSAGTPVSVVDAQVAAPLVITLTPTGAIAGRVTDGSRAVPLVWVRALKVEFFDGRRSFGISAWTQTDDRGEFRLFGLAPGMYYVSAILPSNPRLDGANLITPAIPTRANGNVRSTTAPATAENLDPRVFDTLAAPAVYHPGTTDVERAVAIEVRPGDSVAGLSLALVHIEPRRIRGRVTASDASALASLRITITPILSATDAPIPSPVISDGTFEIARVPPGRYVLGAWSPAANTSRFFGTTIVDVSTADANDVTIAIDANVTVTGTLTLDGRAPVAADGALSVQLQSANPGTPGVGAQRVQPDGTFTIPNIYPGRYRFRVLQAGRFPWVKSARWGSEDVVTAPMVIEGDPSGRTLAIDIGTKTAAMDVTVLDAQRRPAPGVLVVAVPDAARRGRTANYKSASADAQGRARLADLAPGEYRIFATTDIPLSDWQDPDVLRRFETRGELVRLAEAGTAAVTITVLR